MTVAISCAFCGKRRNGEGVRVLIAGPGVSICDACVRTCQRILDNHANGTGPKVDSSKPAQGTKSGRGSRRKRR
jgi:ATP-dependent Clp protease ATP-binding subunit ClpX